MNKLILIRGNSGSGKTSLARSLQHKFGRHTLMISQDVVRREMLWAHDEPGNPAIDLLIHLVTYGHEHCPVTILEGILYSDTYRPLFETIKNLYGDNIFAYYYDIPFEETLKRHETKACKLEFGPEDMERWWKEKDYIGIIPEQKLPQDVSLEQAVEGIYKNVH